MMTWQVRRALCALGGHVYALHLWDRRVFEVKRQGLGMDDYPPIECTRCGFMLWAPEMRFNAESA